MQIYLLNAYIQVQGSYSKDILTNAEFTRNTTWCIQKEDLKHSNELIPSIARSIDVSKIKKHIVVDRFNVFENETPKDSK